MWAKYKILIPFIFLLIGYSQCGYGDENVLYIIYCDGKSNNPPIFMKSGKLNQLGTVLKSLNQKYQKDITVSVSMVHCYPKNKDWKFINAAMRDIELKDIVWICGLECTKDSHPVWNEEQCIEAVRYLKQSKNPNFRIAIDYKAGLEYWKFILGLIDKNKELFQYVSYQIILHSIIYITPEDFKKFFSLVTNNFNANYPIAEYPVRVAIPDASFHLGGPCRRENFVSIMINTPPLLAKINKKGEPETILKLVRQQMRRNIFHESTIRLKSLVIEMINQGIPLKAPYVEEEKESSLDYDSHSEEEEELTDDKVFLLALDLARKIPSVSSTSSSVPATSSSSSSSASSSGTSTATTSGTTSTTSTQQALEDPSVQSEPKNTTGPGSQNNNQYYFSQDLLAQPATGQTIYERGDMETDHVKISKGFAREFEGRPGIVIWIDKSGREIIYNPGANLEKDLLKDTLEQLKSCEGAMMPEKFGQQGPRSIEELIQKNKEFNSSFTDYLDVRDFGAAI